MGGAREGVPVDVSYRPCRVVRQGSRDFRSRGIGRGSALKPNAFAALTSLQVPLD